MAVSEKFKQQVIDALIEERKNYGSSEYDFVRKYGSYSLEIIFKEQHDFVQDNVSDQQWLKLGQALRIDPSERKWNVARTDVFNVIEEDIKFCQKNAKSRIFVDDCAIGKTFTAKYLTKTLTNCFYVDASQATSKVTFIRHMAFSLGLEYKGHYLSVINGIKYYLNSLEKPIVIIDEAGDLRYTAFLFIKELWNATENNCGWYLMGADGLKSAIEKGIKSQKVGYAEVFSRFSNNYSSIVPTDRRAKQAFYKKLIGDVLSVNMDDKSQIPAIVKKCLVNGENVGGLRRAESLLILNTTDEG